MAVPGGHRALFDHLVGPGEQLRMNFEARHLGGLEVDHELESDGTWLIMYFLSDFVGKGGGL